MGRKGASTTLKRKPAPRFWPIRRKEFTFAVKPSPGPHSHEECMPLAVLLRDVLGVAKTRREAKSIAAQGKVIINGVPQMTDDFPTGLMDVITIPELDANFRVLPSDHGLFLHPISKEEAKFKLYRIENKSVVRGGHIQLNLHDGSNLLVNVADPKSPKEDVYETYDTLRIGLKEKQMLDQVKMKEGDYAIITGGKNVGRHGKIVALEKAVAKKRGNSLVTIEDAHEDHYQTILGFVFALGESQSLIQLPEAP